MALSDKVQRVTATVLFKSTDDYVAFKEAYADVIEVQSARFDMFPATPREFMEGKTMETPSPEEMNEALEYFNQKSKEPSPVVSMCPNCRGKGAVKLYDWGNTVTCSRCNGMGTVELDSLTEDERRSLGIMDELLKDKAVDLTQEAKGRIPWGNHPPFRGPRIDYGLPEVAEPKAEPEAEKTAYRPSFDQLFMEIAGTVAKRGTCPRLQVGAVIAVDNRIIATGYNGSPAGLPHCTEVGCLRQKCPVCRGDGRVGWLDTKREVCPECKGSGEAGGCKRTTHAEANALIQCARSGSSPVGGTIYVTHRPCSACTGLIITAGITRLVWGDPYSSDGLEDSVWQMLREAGIAYERWEPGAKADP
jgi:dCMP deaminase